MSAPESEILAYAQAIVDAAKGAVPEIKQYPTMRDAVAVPAIVVLAGEGTFLHYHQRIGGGSNADLFFDVVLLVSRVNEVAAQIKLYSWLDPESAIYQAVDGIPGVRIDEARNVGDYDVGDSTLWGVTWRVSIPS